MKLRLKDIGKKITEPWTPQEVAKVDGHHAYLCLFKGEYVTHKHPGDELFLCLDGEMEIETPDGTVSLKQGEGILIKKGTPHKSRAKKKAMLLMFERIGLQREPIKK
ncbi:MAG: cupin domain-containing protein [Candidatus Eiseniibacteriota bacterium]|nr:MAG: cupin domain-containing protein [Candidatus Eisenbacteria bacterium]